MPRGGDRAHVRCIGENRNWRDQVFTGTWAWNDTFYFGPAGRLLAAVHGADHGLCVAEDPKDTGYYYGSYDFVVHYGRYPLYCDERCLVTGGSDYDHWWKHLKRCPDDL